MSVKEQVIYVCVHASGGRVPCLVGRSVDLGMSLCGVWCTRVCVVGWEARYAWVDDGVDDDGRQGPCDRSVGQRTQS